VKTRKILLFLKKKKQKDFAHLVGAARRISWITAHMVKSLFASFSSEKEESFAFPCLEPV